MHTAKNCKTTIHTKKKTTTTTYSSIFNNSQRGISRRRSKHGWVKFIPIYAINSLKGGGIQKVFRNALFFFLFFFYSFFFHLKSGFTCVWMLSLCKTVPRATSHMNTSPLEEEDAIWCPDGDQDMLYNTPSWPTRLYR